MVSALSNTPFQFEYGLPLQKVAQEDWAAARIRCAVYQ